MRKTILFLVLCFTLLWTAAAQGADSEYDRGVQLGRLAAQGAAKALSLSWEGRKAVVITDAGYASPGSLGTGGCLDGAAAATGTTRGKGDLIAVQTRMDQPLWFAFYDAASGNCAYLEAKPGAAEAFLSGKDAGAVFSVRTQRIDAEHLFAHPETFDKKRAAEVFGPNAFRIVTIANAVAHGCPQRMLRAMEVHDHYCPGVTSGILIGDYAFRNLLAGKPKRTCMVLSLVPWCKEDALTTMLNTTPGKRSFFTLHSTRKEAAESWPEPLNHTCSVIFTQDGDEAWQGHLLGYDAKKADALAKGKSYGSPIIDKLSADLWFLDHLEEAQSLISEVGTVRLPKGQTPRDLMRPEANPLEALAKLL
ncbi:FmdE family protein [Desulfocurvus sp. DL9XJH121]